MARALFSAGDVGDTLRQVVDLAVEAVDGCDMAGVFILEGERVTTPALTDPMVAVIDALQHEVGEGPCLDAIAGGGAVYADDLADDGRWSSFGPGAAAAGVRCALAFRLYADHTLGALNLYARYPRAFGVIDRAKGLVLATLAGLAIAEARGHEAEGRRADNLAQALEGREVIGQAQGILMERERIAADQAFDVLRRASQHLNVKLKAVAEALVETGESPATGGAPASVRAPTTVKAPAEGPAEGPRRGRSPPSRRARWRPAAAP
ncbi:MAG: ANTAR domain-containing protein [Acidimicrobiales bacterium]